MRPDEYMPHFLLLTVLPIVLSILMQRIRKTNYLIRWLAQKWVAAKPTSDLLLIGLFAFGPMLWPIIELGAEIYDEEYDETIGPPPLDAHDPVSVVLQYPFP